MNLKSLKNNINKETYSIWLIPKTNDKITLSRIINKFSDYYNTPKFEPHITILGGFLAKETESIKNLKFLSKKIPPFEIQFGKVSYMNEYFRSIFIEVMLSDKLKELRILTCNYFGFINDSYYPHLSLVYGDIVVPDKLKMIKCLGPSPNFIFIDKLFLVQNNETDYKWKIIESIDLNL